MPSEPRMCCKEGCQNELGVFQRRGSVCRSCQEKDVQVRRLAAKTKRIDDLHAAGFVILHSCISPSDPFDPDCTCRKYITLEHARKMFERGEAIDFERRSPIWGGENRDVLTSSKLKRTPRTASIEKSHIERGLSFSKPRGKTPDELERDHQALRARLAEDRALRSEEEAHRWEVWEELSGEFYKSLTREYSPEQWTAEEARQRTMSCLLDGIGVDDRTSGCHDVNGSWSAVEEDEENDEATIEEIDVEEVAEVIESVESEGTDGANNTEDFDDDPAAEFIRESSSEQLAAGAD